LVIRIRGADWDVEVVHLFVRGVLLSVEIWKAAQSRVNLRASDVS